MATSSKPAAKPGEAKAPKAAAAPAGKVATPKVDEAAAKAALSNQGSGDGNTTTATNGAQGEGAAPAAAPNTAGEGAAPGATSDAPEISDRDIDEIELPISLSRTLFNHTPSEVRLPLLDVILAPGTSQEVFFDDVEHQAACENQIALLAELDSQSKGCCLHWDDCQ